MTACAGIPVSWLRLERYHAGDLDPGARDTIADHLASCEACTECLRHIEDDEARALPPLPAVPLLPAPPKAAPAKPRGGVVVALRRAAPWTVALVAAAAVLVVVGKTPRVEPYEVRVKGGEIAFTLARDDDTVIAEASAIYRDGDRFKAMVTCPPGRRGGFDVVVYERGEAAFPLDPQPELACGNGVALPGAFRVTGHERMTVCLTWSDDGMPVDRDALRRAAPAVPPHALCKVLDPAP